VTFFDLPRADTGDDVLDRYGNAFIEGVENGLRGILPRTQTRLNHGLFIRVKGRGIGAILNFNTSQSAETKDEFEITTTQAGVSIMHPNHIAIQRLSGRSIEVTRADLYLDLMENVFAGNYLDMLADQRFRFDLDEVWREPGGAAFGGGTLWRYKGCVFKSLQRQNDAGGDRVVRVSGTIDWTYRQRIQ
jgi:hypothetical protein